MIMSTTEIGINDDQDIAVRELTADELSQLAGGAQQVKFMGFTLQWNDRGCWAVSMKGIGEPIAAGC
jgi:hypothetical protein